MPKMKTKSGAKKRFKVTATGKIMRKHAYKSHLLSKKSHVRKKRLGKKVTLDSTNKDIIKKCLNI